MPSPIRSQSSPISSNDSHHFQFVTSRFPIFPRELTLGQENTMSFFRGHGRYSGSPFAYSKIDNEDLEEAIHRRAQFLIYKAMEEADCIGSQRCRPCFLKVRLSKVKVKIGNRLKILRRRMLSTISVARGASCSQMMRQFKACKRLFGGRQANSRLPRALLIWEVFSTKFWLFNVLSSSPGRLRGFDCGLIIYVFMICNISKLGKCCRLSPQA